MRAIGKSWMEKADSLRLNTFAALRYPNFRLWFIGQSISIAGTWMQITAQGFLIYQLTGSPVYLGYVGFASGVPFWLFALFGGVVSDRMPRRNLLMITQASMLVLAFFLAWLTAANVVQPWHIVFLAFLLGIANAFDAPARIAFVAELVDREDMTNAIAMNSTIMNLGTVLGPSVAGLVYASFGPAWCFAINGISFLAVILALLLMRLPEQTPAAKAASALQAVIDGLRYAGGHRVIRTLLTVAAIVTTFGMGYTALLPAWSVEVLKGDSLTNGFLQSARGVGSLAAAVGLALISSNKSKGKILTIGVISFPILLLLWANTTYLPLSLLAMIGLGLSMMLALNMTNALLQAAVSDEMRGRVMSLFTFSFFGMMPIGSLISGAIAEWLGEPLAVMAGAAVVLVIVLFVSATRPEIRALE